MFGNNEHELRAVSLNKHVKAWVLEKENNSKTIFINLGPATLRHTCYQTRQSATENAPGLGGYTDQNMPLG